MCISRQECDHLPELWVTLDPCGFRESEKAAPKTRIIENEDAEPVRSSEREPADSLRDKSNVIGGWPPSLTFALCAKRAITDVRIESGALADDQHAEELLARRGVCVRRSRIGGKQRCQEPLFSPDRVKDKTNTA